MEWNSNLKIGYLELILTLFRGVRDDTFDKALVNLTIFYALERESVWGTVYNDKNRRIFYSKSCCFDDY